MWSGKRLVGVSLVDITCMFQRRLVQELTSLCTLHTTQRPAANQVASVTYQDETSTRESCCRFTRWRFGLVWWGSPVVEALREPTADWSRQLRPFVSPSLQQRSPATDSRWTPGFPVFHSAAQAQSM